MKIIIFIYNMLLYPFSFIANIIILAVKLCKNLQLFRADFALFRTQFKNCNIENLTQKSTLQGFFYVPDPEMKLLNRIIKKLFKKDVCLRWNYIPFLFTYYLLNGGDCSGTAYYIYRLLRKVKIKATMYLIMENAKHLTVWEKLNTAHVVTTYKISDQTNVIYNVFDRIITGDSIKSLYTHNQMVVIGDIPYKYIDPLVIRWF